MHDRAGEWHWFETIEINRLDDPDVNGIVTNARDVTAHKAENAELLERSLRDPLTGIPNRLALMERLEIALSRATRARDIVAVLFCDLDDFKLVNDSYGHDFADGVLVEVARRLERPAAPVRHRGAHRRRRVRHRVRRSARHRGVEHHRVAHPRRDRASRSSSTAASASSRRASASRPSTARSGDRIDPGHAAAQRRRRDVPGQAARARALAPLRRRSRPGGDPTLRARSRSRSRARARRVRPALPTDPRARAPHDRRRRGVPALGTSDPRLPRARISSSRSPNRRARSCRSARGRCGPRARRRGTGATRVGRVGCR